MASSRGSSSHTINTSVATRTSSSSPTSPRSGAPPMSRTSTDRSDFERMAYGRHSSDWLFGGFSVRQTVKGIVRKN